VFLQVLLHQRFQQGVVVAAEGALLHEDLAQGFALLEHPGLRCFEESVPADEIHLRGEDSKQQVAVGRGLGHEAVPCARGLACQRSKDQ
jgi:hypothetical protein